MAERARDPKTMADLLDLARQWLAQALHEVPETPPWPSAEPNPCRSSWPDELAAVEEFRYQARMPSRSAAVRELRKTGAGSCVVVGALAQCPVRPARNVDGPGSCPRIKAG